MTVAFVAHRYLRHDGMPFPHLGDSQMILLGIWGGLGTTAWWRRLIGVVLGVSYLCLLEGLVTGEVDIVNLDSVCFVTTVVATLLLIVRGFDIVIHVNASPVTLASRVQFSIRHLLILTFVIACLVAFGKMSQPYCAFGRETFLAWIFFNVMRSVIGVAPVWFVMATKRPVLYGIGWVPVAVFLHYCLLWIEGAIRFGDVRPMPYLATPVMAVVLSLLVVRSYGYRLVRLPKDTTRDRCPDEDNELPISRPVSQSSSLPT